MDSSEATEVVTKRTATVSPNRHRTRHLLGTVSLRAVLFGCLLIPANVYWVIVAELRWYAILTLNPLFVTPVFYLFVLVILSAFLRRFPTLCVYLCGAGGYLHHAGNVLHHCHARLYHQPYFAHGLGAMVCHADEPLGGYPVSSSTTMASSVGQGLAGGLLPG